MSLSPIELRSAIESILFVAGEPVKLEDLAEAFPEAGTEAVQEQLKEIEKRLDEGEFGFRLELAAGGYRLATKPELDPYLRRFFSKRGEGRLSMAALETLAMIAYKQPITGPEISDLRGVNSSGVLRTLLERKLIRMAGRKNVVGSPFLYRTSREFLLHFGLNSIQDLPRLEEFAEILGENLGDELMGGLPESGSEAADSETMAEGSTEGTEPTVDSGREEPAEQQTDEVLTAQSDSAAPEVEASSEEARGGEDDPPEEPAASDHDV
jgi:segregation and condensation protein B